MQKRQKIAAVVVSLFLGLTLLALWRTRQPGFSGSSSAPGAAKSSAASQTSLVDQAPLKAAQQLAQLAATPDERAFAQEVLRLADYEVDLAFDTALVQARLHPPPLSPEVKAIEDRYQKAEKVLKADEDHVKLLAEQGAKVSQEKQEALEIDLIQAEADLELDRDELEDAKQDLIRAGGDLADRIQAAKKEHEDAAHATGSAIPSGQPPPEELGLIHRIQQWMTLHEKQFLLWQAKTQAEAAAARLAAEHNALDAKLDAEKSNSSGLIHHSKKNKAAATTATEPASSKSREEAAALLQHTEQLTQDQKTLSALDKRVEAYKELSGIYSQWINFVAADQRRVLHRGLFGVVIILVLALVALYFGSWMDSLVGQLSMDRRQIQSLHTVTRVSLQFLAALLILLVVFGPPGQLGTFLGLAGAGLTVALKDFIVGFIGWFVLMGKNGIRLGDWVEINGVTGEVVEVGPFHTVLLETGNWTDSSHPTGRRVTFTNSFAIEGHYFNFSTTGQWLWDQLQVVLPTGRDPYPLIDAIQKKVADATRESAQQAEEEWRRATAPREMSGFTAAPAISVRPVLGGVEVTVRYITRASDRYNLRSKLNQAAVELLGARGTLAPSAT